MSALRVIYQDDGHQPETHDGEGARVVLEVGSPFLQHRDALLHLRPGGAHFVNGGGDADADGA